MPYGNKEHPNLPSLDELQRASALLGDALLFPSDYEKALKDVGKCDFVYLDPPYPPLNGTSYFTHYTKARFCENDQVNLANVFRCLDKTGCLLMMTNADTPLIRALYSEYNIAELSVTRYVTCKAKKHRVSELVITNY